LHLFLLKGQLFSTKRRLGYKNCDITSSTDENTVAIMTYF